MARPIDILLVDDEARNLDALEAILVSPDYRLLRAEDADRALRLLLENDVAAIVLDIKMPQVSGFELAQMIKNTRRFRETPIVFLTAYLIDDQNVIAGYDAGAVDYLTKPVNSLVLRHKIAVFAELFRKTRELAELNERLEERVEGADRGAEAVGVGAAGGGRAEGRVSGHAGPRAAQPAGAAAQRPRPPAAAEGRDRARSSPARWAR